MKRRLAMILALTMGITALTGCGGADSGTGDNAPAQSNTESTAQESEESAPESSEGGEITITMVESLTSPERTAIIREIADKYEAEHDNITIEIVSPPLENADNKITQMLMSGSGVDIVETRDLTITQYVNNSWIQPLDQWVEAWEDKDTLTSAAIAAMNKTGGEAYLLPYGFLWRGLYCHKDWFEEKGMELPTTWQEIHDTGVELTDSSQNRFGFAFRGGTLGHQYADNVIWAWIGTDILANPDAGYYLKDKDGETIFTMPEVKEALEFYKSLYTDCSPKDSIAWGFAEMVQGFVGGTTAMLIQDPEVISTCEASLDDEEWELIKFPTGPSGQAVYPNGFAGWAMASFTEHPDEVADFILYLSNPENNTYFAKNYATIPIHSTAPEIDSFFKEGRFAIYMEMAEDSNTYRCATQPMMYNAYATYKAEVDTMYQKWLTEEISTDELMAWLDGFWVDAYEQEGKKY